jgi:hypothetical protein
MNNKIVIILMALFACIVHLHARSFLQKRTKRMIQTCSITSTSTHIQTCNKIDYNPTPSPQNFPFTYPSGLFTISPSTCLTTVSIIASYKNGAVDTLPDNPFSFTSTGFNIKLPKGNAATYNKV